MTKNKKKSNSEWLDKWVNHLEKEMDEIHKVAMYVKKIKVRKKQKR